MLRFRSRSVAPWAAAWLCSAFGVAVAQAPAADPPPASDAVIAAFKRADSDGDGFLTRDESAHLPAVYAKFDEFDADHDGLLSFAEFTAGLARDGN